MLFLSVRILILFFILLHSCFALECKHEPPPTSFDTAAHLLSNNQFHFNGLFSIPHKTHKIDFHITKGSVGRFSIAPPDGGELKLELYDTSKDTPFSVGTGTYQKMIFSNLTIGSWRLELSFSTKTELKECISFNLEAAIFPKDQLIRRKKNLVCPSNNTSHLPDKHNIFKVTKRSIYYDSNEDDSFPKAWFTLQNDFANERWIHGYEFSLKKYSGRNGLWTFKASLSFNFITSGSYGLVLGDQDEMKSSESRENCFAAGKCVVGLGTKINHNVLETVLVSNRSYTLWIRDSLFEDLSLGECSPYSLIVDIEPLKEDSTPLSCEALPPPTTLNSPGLLDPSGYIEYTGQHLLTDSTINFTISTPSFIRVNVPKHKVDIDLDLVKQENSQVVSSSSSWFEDESVLLELDNGSYSIIIKLESSNWDSRICDTFDLHIAIAPAASFSDEYCVQQPAGLKNITPDFSDFQLSLKESPFSWNLLPRDKMYYVPQSPLSSQYHLLNEPFTTDETLSVRVQLNFNFLFGDLKLWITDEENHKLIIAEGKKLKNQILLTTELFPGSYRVHLTTGVVGGSNINSQSFPRCVEFTMKFDVYGPRSSTGCLNYRSLPRTLNSPGYLKETDHVHIMDSLLIPYSEMFNSQVENTYFSVREKSLFRMIGTYKDIVTPIVFNIYEEETLKYSGSVDTQFLIRLEPYTNYRLEVIYTFITPPQAACLTWNLEVSIEPLPPILDHCQNHDDLPPQDLIPSRKLDDFVTNGVYHYHKQTNETKIKLEFSITQPTAFRALIQYHFLYSKLALRLETQSKTQPKVVHSSVLGQNFEEIPVTTLYPNSYALIISEPQIQGSTFSFSCYDFSLMVALTTETETIEEDHRTEDCKGVDLPSTLNRVGFLDDYSGRTIHFHVSLYTTPQITIFEIEETSTFRIDLSAETSLFGYFNLHSTSDREKVLASSFFGSHPLSIIKVLDPGHYRIEITTQNIRTSDECYIFPVEVSISPNSYIITNLAISTPCSPHPPPSTLSTTHSENTNVENYRLSGNYSTHHIRFTVDTRAHFEYGLWYQVETSALNFRLLGHLNEVDVSRPLRTSWESSMGYNHRYLSMGLDQGDYTIEIYNPTEPSEVKDVACLPFTTEHSLEIRSRDSAEDLCLDEELPRDLYTEQGGSKPFGGPQKSDGSIRFFGDKFLAHKGPPLIATTFQLPVETSFLRLFVLGRGLDIDTFVVNSDTNQTIVFSQQYGEIESSIFRLDVGTYILQLHVFQLSENLKCPYYSLELAIKTNDSLAEELLCPSELPYNRAPPKVLHVRDSLQVFSDEYLFTYEDWTNYTRYNIFSYPMELRLLGNTTLSASVGYDFMVNDFQLVLRDSHGIIQAIGANLGDSNRDGYLNFKNGLSVSLEAGLYTLSINQLTSFGSTLPFGPKSCYRFSFSFSAETKINRPEILFVTPPGASNLFPYNTLNLEIVFSRPIGSPDAKHFADEVIGGKLITLEIVGDPNEETNEYLPNSVSVDATHEVVTLSFGPNFAWGRSYHLKVDHFRDHNGTIFEDRLNPSLVYKMVDCFCKNGHCEKIGCVCDDGATGLNCETCIDGYHQAAGKCVPDETCKPDTCHGHGTCENRDGSVHCHCEEGFATIGDQLCAGCAPGYVGYPNCIRGKLPEEANQPSGCGFQVLPRSLNYPQHLGNSGSMHLFGDFFIDFYHLYHDIQFTLKEESILKVQTGVKIYDDVDVHLYATFKNGSARELQKSTNSFGTPDFVWAVLPPNDETQISYKLRFIYYTYRNEECKGFQLQLQVEPVAIIREPRENFCRSQESTLPLNRTEPSLGKSGLKYYPPSTFSIRSDDNREWFPIYQFELPTQLSGLRPYLTASALYPFLKGDLMIYIQKGDFNETRGCPPDYQDCTAGLFVQNGYLLSQELSHRYNYTLVLRRPRPTISYTSSNFKPENCLPFGFSMSIVMIHDESEFICDAPLLPKSLNSPNYLGDNGYLHMVDEFLLTEQSSTSFVLEKKSILRLSLSRRRGEYLYLRLKSQTSGKSWIGQKSEEKHYLFAVLDEGEYLLSFSLPFSSQSCSTSQIELLISPEARYNSGSFLCPVATEHLPPADFLGSGIADIPLVAGEFDPFDPASSRFFAFTSSWHRTNSETFASYSFVIDRIVVFEAQLASDFGLADLTLELHTQQPRGLIGTVSYLASGVASYNNNQLRKLLEPGNYTLRLLHHQFHSEVSCVEFNLRVSLSDSATSLSEECMAVETEPIPTTLNGVRFLGSTGEINYQSSRFATPFQPESIWSSTNTVFTNSLSIPSIFRAYTQPHVVDIDMALFEMSGSSWVMVASSEHYSGAGDLKAEEEIVYRLKPQTSYRLQLKFWYFGISRGCYTFNMEIDISPVNPLPTLCSHSGGDLWPDLDLKKMIPRGEKVSYDSVEAGTTQFYQQRFDSVRSKSYPFSAVVPFNLYAEVGYDFSQDDLMLKLVQGPRTFFASKSRGRAVLSLANLAPDEHYELVIYEPYPNLKEILGCSTFTFKMFIEYVSNDTLNDLQSKYPGLPNLDNLELFGGKIHLSSVYVIYKSMIDNVQPPIRRSVPLTIKDESYFRARVSDVNGIHNLSRVALSLTPVTFNTEIQGLPSHNTSLQGLISAGDYVLTIFVNDLTEILQDRQVLIYLELAVAPVTDIRSHQIAPDQSPHSCESSAFPSIGSSLVRGEFFQFREDWQHLSHNDRGKRELLYTSSFVVQSDVTFFALIGYEFLLDALEINLFSSNQSTIGRKTPVVTRRNEQEIHSRLSPGEYTLQLSQPQKFDNEALAHCAVYQLILFAGKEFGRTMDCTYLKLIPWTLNDAIATAPYGGTFTGDGILHFRGDEFYIPSSGHDTHGTQTISIYLYRPSLISVFSTGGSVQPRLAISAGEGSKVNITEIYTHAARGATDLALFWASPVKDEQFKLELTSPPTGSKLCPQFGLDIEIAPFSLNGSHHDNHVLSHEIQCPSISTSTTATFGNIRTPPERFTLEDRSISYYQSSQWPSEVRQWTIKFSVKKASTVDLTMRYNSLVSFFEVLLRKESDQLGFPSRLQIASVAKPLNAESTIFQQIGEGDYLLEIIFRYPETFYSGDHVPCIPYQISFEVLPAERNYPHITRVSPREGYGLSPKEDLVLLVTFSTPVYIGDVPVDQSTILTGIYLSSNNSDEVVYPIRAEQGQSQDEWRITFSAGTLKNSQHYRLGLAPDVFNSGGTSFSQHVQTDYVTLSPTCGNHGSINSRGECECEEGYVGNECTDCAEGYVFRNGECVQHRVEKCNENTCNSHGVCDDSSGVTICSCKKGYAGQHCELCAEGYMDYPHCYQKKECENCPIERGMCNLVTGECLCFDNFEGEHCERCAPGYSGEGCFIVNQQQESPYYSITIAGILFSAMVVTVTFALLIWRFIQHQTRKVNMRYAPLFELDDDPELESQEFPQSSSDQD